MAAEHHIDMYTEDYPQTDPPTTVDSERSPQLNKVVCRCRCGCTCASSRGNGEGGPDTGGQVDSTIALQQQDATDAISENAESVDGDEGADDHQIEVGDLGLVSMRTIHIALARHRGCVCGLEIMPEEDDYPFSGYNSLEASGYLSDGSMLAGLGSDERSRSSLSVALSAVSGSSGRRSPGGFVPFVGVQFEHHDVPTIPYHFLQPPISLAPEHMGLGLAMHYPIEIELDHSEYDMW